MRKERLVLILVAATVLSAGCALRREYPAPDYRANTHALHARPLGTDRSKESIAAVTPVHAVADQPLNVLVLSGGGMNGAFTAGVLEGWTNSGARPAFDVVTGISTGAIIAPIAFLGPKYDHVLRRYRDIDDRDVYRRRRIAGMAWWESLADSRPLARMIESEFTDEVLDAIGEAHRAGRRLYVGTTNLDTKRLVVWDIGAIANGNHPQKLHLCRKILLASCSVPPLLPPVSVNVELDGTPRTELHVDGGVSASLFLHPHMLGLDSDRTFLPGIERNVFVIIAGKLHMDPLPVRRRVVPVTEESFFGVLKAQMEGDLFRVFEVSRRAGAQFGFAAVPQSCQDASPHLDFDPKRMRRLFDEGYRFGLSNGPWRTTPPGVDPSEWQPPRNGVRLTTEPAIENREASPSTGPTKH